MDREDWNLLMLGLPILLYAGLRFGFILYFEHKFSRARPETAEKENLTDVE